MLKKNENELGMKNKMFFRKFEVGVEKNDLMSGMK